MSKEKKRRKAELMWIEQAFLEIDSLKADITKLKDTVKDIRKDVNKLKRGKEHA